jgi:uncharacterized alkaline shock family protein YloU
MASEATEQSRQATSEQGRTAGAEGGSALASERGRTAIDDTVVEKVVGMAAREVPGVHELGGGTERAMGAVTQRVGIADARSQGVSVEVGERQTAADLTVVIDYGESIPRVTQRVRDNVIKRVEGICGLEVTEVNISVNDLYFPGDEQPAESRVE